MQIPGAHKTEIRHVISYPSDDVIGTALNQLDIDIRIDFLKMMDDLRKPVDGNTGKGGDRQRTGLQTVDLTDDLFQIFVARKQRADRGQDLSGVRGQLDTLFVSYK